MLIYIRSPILSYALPRRAAARRVVKYCVHYHALRNDYVNSDFFASLPVRLRAILRGAILARCARSITGTEAGATGSQDPGDERQPELVEGLAAPARAWSAVGYVCGAQTGDFRTASVPAADWSVANSTGLPKSGLANG